MRGTGPNPGLRDAELHPRPVPWINKRFGENGQNIYKYACYVFKGTFAKSGFSVVFEDDLERIDKMLWDPAMFWNTQLGWQCTGLKLTYIFITYCGLINFYYTLILPRCHGDAGGVTSVVARTIGVRWKPSLAPEPGVNSGECSHNMSLHVTNWRTLIRFSML